MFGIFLMSVMDFGGECVGYEIFFDVMLGFF